jgi:hypothetical protein
MSGLRSPVTAAIVLVTLVSHVTGCTLVGSPGPSATPVDTGPISHATGPADLVLQATFGGGLLSIPMRLAEMPNVSMYGDGRVVTLDSRRYRPDDPLVPGLTETRVTADGLDRILRAARDAGVLGQDRHFDMEGVYDLWSVWFTSTTDGVSHRVSAYALGFSDEARLAPPGDLEARRKLDAFYGQLLDLRAWLPDGAVGAGSPYRPAGTRVFLTRLVDWSTAVGGATPAPAKPLAGQEVRAWPLADPPEALGPALGTGDAAWRCAVVGEDRVAALDLATARLSTRWRAGAYLYELVVRPLLPDESGCPAGI